MTASIIAANALVFLVELTGGEAFVTTWSVVPRDIVAGQHLLTILTGMFMHASWSHIIGNMVFLWAFGPEIEDLMSPPRYLAFYLLAALSRVLPSGRARRDGRAGCGRSELSNPDPGREWGDCCGDGRVSRHLPP
jgi:membrane associated rhomboid family serine protease